MLREREITFGENWARTPGGLLVPPGPEPVRRKPVCLGLFVGAGGFDLGVTMAGFHVAGAVEFERNAAATYLVNLGCPDTVVHTADGVLPRGVNDVEFGSGWISSRRHEPGEQPSGCECARCVDAEPCEHFWLEDIRKLSGRAMLDALGLAVGELDLVIGGPPCQGFSHSGNRDVMDPRNSLVFEFARIVRETKPKAFLMENVAGIVSMVTPDGIPVIDALARQLSDGDYGDFQALRKGLLSQVGAGIGTPYTPPREQRPAGDDLQAALDFEEAL